MNRFEPPDWLEPWRIGDAARQEAYDAAGPKGRAALKTALSLAAFHHQPAPELERSLAEDSRLGLWRVRQSRPADWVLIIFDSSCASAARVCAAAALPRLAGVPCVFAVCASGKPSYPALAALELAGVEDVYQATASQTERILLECADWRGRALLLHEGSLPGLVEAGGRLGITFYEERRKPALFLETPEDFDQELLLFAQGFAPPVQKPPARWLDAIYTSHCQPDQTPDGARLTLPPGCEGYWAFPDLDISFFRLSAQACGLASGGSLGLR